MGAGVGSALVKANAGNVAVRVGPESDTELYRRVGANVDVSWSGARPDRTGTTPCGIDRDAF